MWNGMQEPACIDQALYLLIDIMIEKDSYRNVDMDS